MIRRIATYGLWLSGLATLARHALARRGSFVLTFHGVAASRDDALPATVQPSFAATELRTALRWIRRHFDWLTPSQFLQGERRGVLLTFDDGFANNATNALPVLEELDAPAIFFVTTQHIRDPRDWLPATRKTVHRFWSQEERVPEPIARDFFDGMSVEQLVTCAKHPLLTIGSHTTHHPFLTDCDDATLAAELEHSKAQLEEWCGRPIDLLAYPTGDYDLGVARATRAAGYSAAFAENSRRVGLPSFEIPRIGLYDYRSPYLAGKLSGLYRPPLLMKKIADVPKGPDRGGHEH